jgi:hypothetical protein
MEVDKIEPESQKNNDSFQGLINTESLGKISAIIFGALYLCGFLTLNSHLYKFGVVELGIASTEYLVAGATFVLYLVVYGIFAGRSIVLSKHWLGQHIDHLKENGAPAISPFIAFIHMLVEQAFFLCMSAALFSLFAFGGSESANFYAVLVGILFISYALDTSNWDVRHPFAHLIIDGVLKIAAVLSFFYLSSGPNIYIVFAAFFGYSFYINLVLDSFERYRITKDRIVFSIGYTVIFLLLAAVSFGSGVYGQVSKKIGGGAPVDMIIGLSSKALEKYPGEIGNPIIGKVVYSSSAKIYINIEKDTLVIPQSSVQWMKFQKTDNDGLLNFINSNEEEEPESPKEPNKTSKADAEKRAAS